MNSLDSTTGHDATSPASHGRHSDYRDVVIEDFAAENALLREEKAADAERIETLARLAETLADRVEALSGHQLISQVGLHRLHELEEQVRRRKVKVQADQEDARRTRDENLALRQRVTELTAENDEAHAWFKVFEGEAGGAASDTTSATDGRVS